MRDIKRRHIEMDDDGWSSIPEEEPDEIDLQMIREALGDPDCREFVSAEEILSSLD